MKAQLINRSVSQNCSFILENHSFKNFLKFWHYHPKLELVVILESTGTRFVGDSIENFKVGEIVLIGKNLPHLWLNDRIYFDKGKGLRARAHVLHFDENFAGGLFEIPELAGIKDLFKRAERGIKFQDKSNRDILTKIDDMFRLSEYDKIMSFIDILKCLSEQKNYKLLSSAGYVNSFSQVHNSKIVMIYEYIMNNFKDDVSLNKVAEIASMNPAAFSRYFKSIHKSTFIRYLNEVRIGYACKLLIEDKYTIAEVCYESGFNNISNFNRQFRFLKNMSRGCKIECVRVN